MAANLTLQLTGLPLVNQLQSPTTDGQPDENARENCVPSSLAAAFSFLLQRQIEPDTIHDLVYGQGYVGVQSAATYVAYAAKLGIRLTPVNGAPAALLPIIHQQLALRHPVIATIPSQWANPWTGNGYTHVVCFAGAGVGVLRAMNPWGGFWQDENDAWWQARLAYNQIWIVSLATEAQPMATPYKTVKGPDGSTWYEDTRTGKQCGGGVYAQYVVPNGYPACIMTEHPAPGWLSAGTITGFGDPAGNYARDGLVFWDSKLKRITAWNSHVALAYESEIATLKQQLAAQAASAPATSASEEATHALNVVRAIKTQVASF